MVGIRSFPWGWPIFRGKLTVSFQGVYPFQKKHHPFKPFLFGINQPSFANSSMGLRHIISGPVGMIKMKALIAIVASFGEKKKSPYLQKRDMWRLSREKIPRNLKSPLETWGGNSSKSLTRSLPTPLRSRGGGYQLRSFPQDRTLVVGGSPQLVSGE